MPAPLILAVLETGIVVAAESSSGTNGLLGATTPPSRISGVRITPEPPIVPSIWVVVAVNEPPPALSMRLDGRT